MNKKLLVLGKIFMNNKLNSEKNYEIEFHLKEKDKLIIMFFDEKGKRNMVREKEFFDFDDSLISQADTEIFVKKH